MTSTDFIKLVNKHYQTDMSWFFDQWLYGSDIPKYEFAYKVTELNSNKYKVVLKVNQYDVDKDFRAVVPIKVLFDDNKIYRLKLDLSGNKTEYELPLFPLEPQEIIFNDFGGVICEVEEISWD